MKNFKLFIIVLLLTLVGCSPDSIEDSSPTDPIDPTDPTVVNTITLHYQETAKLSSTQKLLVEDPRELSTKRDIFSWGDLGKIARNEYSTKSYIEYNKVEKTFKFFHPGVFTGEIVERLMVGNYKVLSYYIETSVTDKIGSLVLVLEDDLTSHDLRVRFINTGLQTVNQQKYLVEITGKYSYVSPNTNSYFNKNFSLTFHTTKGFLINQDTIIVDK